MLAVTFRHVQVFSSFCRPSKTARTCSFAECPDPAVLPLGPLASTWCLHRPVMQPELLPVLDAVGMLTPQLLVINSELNLWPRWASKVLCATRSSPDLPYSRVAVALLELL